jgi:hypothetical protein
MQTTDRGVGAANRPTRCDRIWGRSVGEQQRSDVQRRATVIGVGFAVALAGVLFLAACSDGESDSATTTTVSAPSTVLTTTTTLPPAELEAALKKFFGAEGKPLLQFEEITKPFSSGQRLNHDQCQPYIKELGAIGTPDEFVGLALRIPDPELRKAFSEDVGAKRLYLAACDTSTPLPPDAGRRIMPYTVKLREVLAKHGYTI